MEKQIQMVALSCQFVGLNVRPQLLYAGNVALHDTVRSQLEERLDINVTYAENVRPSLGVEQLEDARAGLAEIYRRFKMANLSGMDELGRRSKGGLVPTARAFGRIIRFMGQREEGDVLGIDIGSASTTVASSLGSSSYLKVLGRMGVGHNATQVLEHIQPEDLARWLTSGPDAGPDALNYVWNKSAFPVTVPQTADDVEYELALARELMRVALSQARQQWPASLAHGLLPNFRQIVVSGNVLAGAPQLGYSALAMLDALQPVGITQLLLDAHGVAAALGAASQEEARAAIDIIDTGGFINLGTAVCPVGRARRGKVALRVELIHEGEKEGKRFNVPFGSIALLPLEPGLRARLKLRARGLDLNLPEGGRTIDVVGGALGVIVDARGRPLAFPKKLDARLRATSAWRDAMLGDSVL